MIDNDVVLGANVKIFEKGLVNLFGCTIGDDSFIGPFVEITRGVTIGKRCKIESHSFICDSVQIKDDVFIGHGVMFTNDLYPKVDKNVEYISTIIREGVSVGSNATIVCGVTIGRYSVVGAGAVVVKDVPDYAIAAGNPAKLTHEFGNQEDMDNYMRKRQGLKK